MSGEIKNKTRSVYHIAYGPDGTKHIGRTEVGQRTVTGQPNLIYYEDPIEFLSGVGSIDFSGYNELPEAGSNVTIQGGEIYSYSGKLVIARQDHERTIYPPDQTPALFTIYQTGIGRLEWIAGERVAVGDLRDYTGQDYRVIQGHVTQSGWEPPTVPALWIKDKGLSDWVQPLGAFDAYNSGDRCIYNVDPYSGVYESLINANVWSPTTYPVGWLSIQS